MSGYTMSEGAITDEALRRGIELLGVKLRIRNIFNTEATRDTIKHFVDGIGDTNPLWQDEEYAKKTRYGTIIAPPSWLYSVFPTWVLHGLPGVHAFHGGNEWIFYRPVMLGDKVRPEFMDIGYEVKRSRLAEKMVLGYGISKYYNQRNELIAVAITWGVRTERRKARERGKLSSYRLPHPWTQEQLRRIEEEMLEEERRRRGPNPRYWEDVEIGEEMKLTKGPLGLTDMIAFTIGTNPVGIKAFLSALKEYRRHPAWAYRDPETHALEPIYSVHYNKYAAQLAGVPAPYDVGIQRQCFLIQMITDWMGDEGWLKRNYAEYRGFFFFSDVVWFVGKVVDKFIDEDGEPCVGIETHAVNQRGEDIMPGYSIVALPSRELNYWPVEARLRGMQGKKPLP